MRKLIIVFFGIAAILSACVSSSTDSSGPDSTNAVKLGTARVIVNFDVVRNVPRGETNSQVDGDPLRIINENEVCVATSPLFSNRGDSGQEELNVIKLNREGNRFYGEVPVECLQEIGIFCLKEERGFLFGGMQIPLNQNDSTILSIQLFEDGQLYSVECQNSQGLSGLDLRVIGEIFTQGFLYDLPHMLVSENQQKMYEDSWEEVRKIEMDSILPRYLESSIYRCKTLSNDEFYFRGMGIPKTAERWVMNDLKIAFAVDEILPYVHRAKVALGRKVADPPMEAYSFLDSINFTPDLFLMTSTDLPQRYILERILKIPGSGIEEIGETPVAKWQKELKQILAPAIKEPTKLLMDLLAGMSYVLQIDKGIPLSEEQISNIDKGFTDDIGKIVLSYNTDLARRAQEH